MIDWINGSFELLGGFAIWGNVSRLAQDKVVKGIDPKVQAFFMAWGFWNCVAYYPGLNQWASFSGALVICAGNFAWLRLAIRYSGWHLIKFGSYRLLLGPSINGTCLLLCRDNRVRARLWPRKIT